MLTLLVAIALPACSGQSGGADPAPPGAGPDGPDAGADGAGSGPDVPVGTPAPTSAVPDDRAQVHADAVRRRALPWSRVEVLGPSTLRVHLVLGAPPCSVLAEVQVVETPQHVRIGVLEGQKPGADCDGPVPPLAAPRYVDITLDAPLDGREIIDAAR